MKRVEESDRLFLDTLEGNEEAVAAQIEKVHMEETAPLHYNREDSLRSVIKLAYYTYKDHMNRRPAVKRFNTISSNKRALRAA